MAVANSDSVPGEFFPGILSAGKLTPGSEPSRTPPPDTEVPDGDSGVPGVGTMMDLSYQCGPGESASTQQPGQLSGLAGLMGVDAGEAGDSGAGGGSTDAWGRYSWQSAPGRNG